MSSNVLFPFGSKVLTLTAGQSIALYCAGTATIHQLNSNVGHPDTQVLVQTVTDTGYTSSAFTTGATLVIANDGYEALYEVGISPAVKGAVPSYVPDPTTLNATGTITATKILSGVVTSTTAAAVAGTVATGSVMEAASDWSVGETFFWSVVNTGGNTFTVTADTGHTLVGVAAVATVTTGRFSTRKTALNTFVTTRVS